MISIVLNGMMHTRHRNGHTFSADKTYWWSLDEDTCEKPEMNANWMWLWCVEECLNIWY